MRVLVTGATGFVGRALTARLVERGHSVHALVRRPIEIPGCETRVGDLSDDIPDLPAVDAVVHLASPPASGSAGESDALYERVIVSGIARLIEKLGSTGARRVVYASTVKVIGEDSGDVAWSEATPEAPETAYGRSKLAAERLLHAAPDLEGVVLRFPILYGPGMTTPNMLRLFRAVQRGVPLPFGMVRNRRSLLFIEHAVDALVLGLEHADAGGKTFMVADDPPLSTPQLLRGIGRASGRPARLIPVPGALWKAVGRLGDLLPQGVPAVRTEHVRRLLGNLVVDSTRLRAELGFTSRVPLEQALRSTAEWYGRAAAT